MDTKQAVADLLGLKVVPDKNRNPFGYLIHADSDVVICLASFQSSGQMLCHIRHDCNQQIESLQAIINKINSFT
jgi:hypothetical protein